MRSSIPAIATVIGFSHSQPRGMGYSFMPERSACQHGVVVKPLVGPGVLARK